MDVGADMIGIVKNSTKLFWKGTIEKLTKFWSGGPYFMLRINPVLSEGEPIISIGCNFNACKVLSFIVTDILGSTKAVLSCLSK